MTDSETRSFLIRRDRWGHGMAIWIIAVVVLAMPPIIWSLSNVNMDNDVEGWLPKDDPQAKVLDWYRTSFPTEDRILVSWDDCSISDPRLKLIQDHLEGQLLSDGSREGGSTYVSSVSLPSGLLKRMLDRDIPFETAIDRVNGLLCGRGPLRIRLTQAGRAGGDAVLEEILAGLNRIVPSGARLLDAEIPEPSTAIDLDDTAGWKFNDALTAWIRSQPDFDCAVTWPNMHSDKKMQERVKKVLKSLKRNPTVAVSGEGAFIEDVFFIDGSQAALTVTLSETGVAERKESLKAVRLACLESGVAEENLRLGGRPVVSAELNNSMKRAGWNRAYKIWDFPHRSPILFSILISLVLSLWMLRSMRLAILVQAVAVLTVMAAVALVPVTGGSMSMVLVVMPTLLAVLTTSAAIHLANYWKHASARDQDGSVVEAASTAWLPCFLASGTTAIGLGSLFVSNLIPVKDFGVYSAVGCVISFFMVLYLLPSLMLYWRRSPPGAETVDTRHWKSFGERLIKLRYSVAVVCLLLTAACGYGLYEFRTETKVIRYFPPESRLYRDYVFLEENLSGIISVDTVVRFNKEAQEQMSFLDRARKVMNLQSKIRDHREISGTLSLASFLDLRHLKDLSFTQRRRVKLAQSQTEDTVKKKLHAGGEEAQEIASLLAIPETATPEPAPGEPKLNEAGDELWRISAQASILSDVDLHVLTTELDAIAIANLAGIIGKNEAGEPIPVEGVQHVVTGLIPVLLRTQQAVLESLIYSFGMAFLLIAIVMMILLRSVRAGLITMLPNLMPVVIVFGLLSWARLRVDIGTMITASVALGIAVDGTLHLITWFQELISRGRTIPEAVSGALEHCGPALWQTSAIVGLGMVALFPAELLLISRFGWMLAALIFAALISDIIFLPALLAGPLGTLIQRSTLRQQAKASSQQKSIDIAGKQHAAATVSLSDGLSAKRNSAT